jgi:hypothetical protein
MATYLPNVKDYIPQLTAYTPDFKFLSDALDERQDRYNKSTQQLNNLYGQVVHSDLSRKDNQDVRDEYTKVLAPKIQQITGLDFSLAQNVKAAQGLFKPFYEDKNIVFDMVYTKSYKDQMGVANSFKNSSSEIERKKYWDKGVEYMNFQLEDFKNKSRNESVSSQLPQYFQNPDLFSRAIKALETGGPDGKGIKTTEMYIDQSGQFIVTMENGTQLTNKPTGRMVTNPNFNAAKKVSDKNPKEIAEMYNPAANRIKETVLEDPLVQQGLRVAAYVDGRKTYEKDSKEQNIPIEQAKKNWAIKIINEYGTESTKIIDKEKLQLNNTNEQLASWENYKSNGELIEGSSEYERWLYEQTKAQIISAGIAKSEQRQKDILTDINEEDVDNLLDRAYAAYISNSITTDIFNAANQYRDETSKKTVKESQIYIQKLKFQLGVERDRIDRQAKLQDARNQKLQEALEQQAIDNVAPTAIGGDALQNIQFYGNQIEQNENGELKVLKNQTAEKIQAITTFYSFMADGMITDADKQNMADYRLTDLNKQTGQVSTAGIYLPNLNSKKLEFYRWDDAYPMLVENPEILNYHWNKVVAVHNDQNLLPHYKKEQNTQLRNAIGDVITKVEATNVKLDLIKNQQSIVYKNILAEMDLSKFKSGLGGENLEDWNIDLFDDNGQMRTTKEIYDTKLIDIENQLRNVVPKTLPSTQQLADQFYNSKTQSWITTEQNPKSPLSAKELANFRRSDSSGIMFAYYSNMVKEGAEALGIDKLKFFQVYYSLPKEADENIKLASKPGSNNSAYADIAQDYLEFGTFKPVIDKVKNAMSAKMEEVNSVPGETTFDFNSAFYNNSSTGDKGIAQVVSFDYVAGTRNQYVINELDHLFGNYNALKSKPGGVSVVVGDHGNAYEDLTLSEQKVGRMLLDQIGIDRSYIPGKTTKSNDPRYKLEYSEVGGGESAQGKYAMYKFILDGDYAKSLEKQFKSDGLSKFKIEDNTITMFFNKELFSNDEDSDRQYSSGVKSMILYPPNQGVATLNVDNGGVVHFEMNNGIVYEKLAQYKYITNGVGTGNMVLTDFMMRPLVTTDGYPIADIMLDKYYSDLRKELELIANTNLLAQTNYKKSVTP